MDAIKRIEIEGFRGFDHLVVDDLAQINLIVGRNNVGKTALLEALFISASPTNYALAARLNAFRGLNELGKDTEETFGYLFNHGKSQREFRIKDTSGQGEVGELTLDLIRPSEARAPGGGPIEIRTSPESTMTMPTMLLRMRHVANGEPSGTTIGSNDSRGYRLHYQDLEVSAPSYYLEAAERIAPLATGLFSSAVRGEGRDTLIQRLRGIEPRLEWLELLDLQGTTSIFATLEGDRPVPIQMMGDGFSRALSFFLVIRWVSGGTLLIDEIETGIYHEAMPQVWRSLMEAARDAEVQVFATTHSYEAIQALNQARNGFLVDAPSVRVIRLDRVDGRVVPVEYDEDLLDVAVSMGSEVR